jgi:vanillate O-demethylase monooxygenase subunit
MGDPAKADPSKILDIPYLANPAWRGVPDYLHYDANYLLIVDNLSDFAHLAFVHTKTLGGSEEYAYKSKPLAIERLEDGFRVERWHMNAPCPPFHKKVVRNVPFVDRRNVGRMHVPGIFFLESLFGPAGLGLEKGNMVDAKQYRNCQFFTPETKRSTHFFWNYLHDYSRGGRDDRAFAPRQHGRRLHGGQVHHRGQQEMLDADPDFKMHGIVSDAPLAHFRRTLGKLIEAERVEAIDSGREAFRRDTVQV